MEQISISGVPWISCLTLNSWCHCSVIRNFQPSGKPDLGRNYIMDSFTRPAIVLLSIAALWNNKANGCARMESWDIWWKTPQVDQKKFDCSDLCFNIDIGHLGLQAPLAHHFTRRKKQYNTIETKPCAHTRGFGLFYPNHLKIHRFCQAT